MASRRAFLKGLSALPVAALASRAGAQTHPDRLTAMLGDYKHSHALHTGAVKSSRLQLDIAPVAVPSTAFARTVAMEFDVSELSLVTFLQAKAAGRRLVLVPAVYLSRFQHPYLLYNSEKGTMTPKDLEGARVGVRLFTATTPSWIRGILADDYGVDISKIQWRAWQAPNVPEWKDPPNVTMIPAPRETAELGNMLLRGEVDAIVLEPIPKDPRIKSVIPNPDAAARAWSAKHRGAIQVNHMVVVKEDLTRTRPESIRELYRLFAQSKRMANEPANEAAFTPMGLEPNRNNIEVVIDYAFRTGMIPRRFSVDELFNDLTATLV
jgi:4,5-dihydroxyphthalate decarboxylase